MVTSVIQLRRMNCDGPWGVALLGGQPLRMVLVNCQRTPGGNSDISDLKTRHCSKASTKSGTGGHKKGILSQSGLVNVTHAASGFTVTSHSVFKLLHVAQRGSVWAISGVTRKQNHGVITKLLYFFIFTFTPS